MSADILNYVLGVALAAYAAFSIYANHCAYQNGVSDGYFNTWLPHVKAILKRDAKWNPRDEEDWA